MGVEDSVNYIVAICGCSLHFWIAHLSVAHCSQNAFCIAETGDNQVLNGLERSQALFLVWVTDGFFFERRQ